MTNEFHRVLTMLRKERKLSQKQTAIDLGISQALLSHYEKGIRECGLDFILKVADYFEVSCDFLLGRSPDPKGATISVDEIPNSDLVKEQITPDKLISEANKKLIFNSITVLIDIIRKYDDKERKLMNETVAYIMMAVYNMFRIAHRANPYNSAELFSVDDSMAAALVRAQMSIGEAKVAAKAVSSAKSIKSNKHGDSSFEYTVSLESLSRDYSSYSTSLLNLIHNVEKKLK
ncbi:MAG: helix-turn-helix domain-containing protein [Oscillospiraceae bacterium]|nr:helix-turn-helix domain-containing protein [Oscillospiraceae bacterium]